MNLVQSGSASDLCLISIRESNRDLGVDEYPVKRIEFDWSINRCNQVTSCRLLCLVFRENISGLVDNLNSVENYLYGTQYVLKASNGQIGRAHV